MGKGIVLLSGGFDSAVLLCWAKKYGGYDQILALTFLYGQNNEKEEVAAAAYLCQKWGIEHKVMDIKAVKEGLVSSYTTKEEITMKRGDYYVPNRNLLFLTIAHAYAQSHDYSEVLMGLIDSRPDIRELTNGENMKERLDNLEDAVTTGVLQSVGLPDATPEFMQNTIMYFSAWSPDNIRLHFPFAHISKTDLHCFAEDYGILDELLANVVSCFNGDTTKHEWGLGCGKCPACTARMRSFSSFNRMQ